MKYYILSIFGFLSCLFSVKSYAQFVTIAGAVNGAEDLENIHVINKTSEKYTITNKTGEFTIPVKLNDTLQFSSIQYNVLEVVVDQSTILNKAIRVNLKELVTALEEVVVGEILTGNLMLDIGNASDGQGYNFFDVGVTGLLRKKTTKMEERYNQSKSFKVLTAPGGAGASFSVNSVINGLTGRTKSLREYVKMEQNDKLIFEIRNQIAVMFFDEHPLDEDYRMDFWYFCSEDPNFNKRCNSNIDEDTIVFLNVKYNEYIKNLNSTSK
ncbi:hypothetical protein FNB79_01510 [Formosa sediminum]|uniref:Carboxypeptidase-like regulatory domain-containing protein n=1 Tax=Formosa sediminum TaxID=2594004 RepID=A0A516GMV4_9FLAO|nr:carboxypeptidase-like regulatory domain-containing protein [Formosa sediminum]QDO92710.1 hypothetical protein FNB79_01510 [Formosa sediminum]